jgi:hypothetical protein
MTQKRFPDFAKWVEADFAPLKVNILSGIPLGIYRESRFAVSARFDPQAFSSITK